MITFILLGLGLGLIVYVLRTDMRLCSFIEKLCCSFLMFIFLTVIVSLITLFIGAMSDSMVEYKRVDQRISVYSLRNESGVNGSFFLGSGNISRTEYYYTFIRDARGGYERFKIQSSICYLFQDENESPYISWQDVYYRPPKWLLIWPSFSNMRQTKYDIHIPENTIIQKYEIR